MGRQVGSRAGIALAILIGCSMGGGARAQEKSADALFTDTFAADVTGWGVIGPHGAVERTTDAANVKSGKGALLFRYHIGDKPGEKPIAVNGLPFDALVRATPGGLITGMQSLSFWARSDTSAPFVVALSEKGGGRYVSMFWLPAGPWQQVTLRSSDFWLADDKNDPKDPDGKLDMDQVENISLLNVWSAFALTAGDSPESLAVFSPFMGPHTLALDDFTASTVPTPLAAPEPTLPTKTKGIWAEDLRSDTLFWGVLGRAEMRIDTSASIKGRAIRVDYTQGGGQFIAMFHDMHRFNLAGTDRLTFEVASAKSMKVVVQLEEKGGAKYNAIIDVPGDSVPTRKSIAFSEFTLADDSPKDPDGQLDLDQVKTLTIVDISSAFGLDKQKNTFWIGPIRAISQNL